MTGKLLEAPEGSTNFEDKVSKVIEDFKLTALDRCDRCGAQAYIEVSFETGKLLFCSHHFVAKKAALLPLSSVTKVRDESGRLHIKPKFED